ncbi:MAG TPA: hypothetical protein VE487_15690 [Ilumatobacter sp.]|nr:hypothetical protein [Ilumatobacter sp.]
MFVQVIEGRTSDPDGLRRQFENWVAELEPGARGYLGTTAGVASDGRVLALARFESEEAARANSERPEQGAWWAETEKLFEGPAQFTESSDVETFLGGGSDDAGFVQVMKLSGVDRERVKQMDKQFEPHASKVRPDLIGGLRVWTGPDRSIDVNYFTSEEEARAGERREPPPELAAGFAEFESMMSQAEFIDLSDPYLYSA